VGKRLDLIRLDACQDAVENRRSGAAIVAAEEQVILSANRHSDERERWICDRPCRDPRWLDAERPPPQMELGFREVPFTADPPSVKVWPSMPPALHGI
jgi:collagenase-like PrtC family protease